MHVALRFLAVLAAVLASAAAPGWAQDGGADIPRADAFGPGAPRTWFAGCTFEADRYVSCKTAARPILDAIATPSGTTPGEALQARVAKVFTDKGCTFDVPPETFRVNGIFLSFDSSAAPRIACGEKEGVLVFKPGVITLLDTLYFIAGEPPQ